MSARIRLGRLFGIPIGVQPAWLLIVGLLAWSLGAGYYPEQVDGISGPSAYGLGLASALLLFGGILLHELGHALVARRRGVEIEEIDLWLLGGVARMKGQPRQAGDELAFAAAGPTVTLVIALFCGGLAAALPASSPAALRALLDYLAFVNAAILVLNLLPAFPLDGGRITRALIWRRVGDLRKATITAARLGRAIGWALIVLGVVGTVAGVLAGFWSAVIGVFVIWAAKAEEDAARLHADLVERPAFLRAPQRRGAARRRRFRPGDAGGRRGAGADRGAGGKPATTSPGSDGWQRTRERRESDHAQTSKEKGPPMKDSVLIAGGGVAALEAALALEDLAGDRAEVTICSPRPTFVYRPYAVGVPYGVSRVATYWLEPLAAAAGARYRCDSIASVDRDARLAVTHDGASIPYDDLIVCPGTKLLWPVPGAITFWGIADEGDVRSVLREIRAGATGRVAFTMPSADSWALPLYELALLCRAELDKTGHDAELTIVTPEDAPLQVFGRGVVEGMEDLLAERRIEVRTGTHPARFEDGFLETAPGDPLPFDWVVSLPKVEGRRIRGVPHDPEGFVRIDPHCKVLGGDRVYAAGDVTNFPVKQGGIATQQADVAAEAIAASLGADLEPAEFDPILRGVLWTGGEPRFLQGWLSGGHGETSTFSESPPWGPDQGKIVGRYLTGFLAGVTV